MKGKENKPHIGIFGRRNFGKSSIINALAGQQVAIVSDIAGTTTDPVKKSMEIAGIGPVIIIDTAGIDDIGELGDLRVKKTNEIIPLIDLAILVITNDQFGPFEEKLIKKFNDFSIPFILINNKADQKVADKAIIAFVQKKLHSDIVNFSALTLHGLDDVINLIRKYLPETVYQQPSLLGGLVKYGDIVLLITPIDIEAPEGRLILPQVQTIRDILDNDCVAIVVKEKEVDSFLKNTGIKPSLVISDSQVILKACASIPDEIPITGFSILLAHYKGDFVNYLKGTPKINDLKNGDKILILESCTHHVSCDDIGRVKIPRWLSQYTGKELQFDVVSGLDNLPREIQQYALVIQCGGCVLTRRQIMSRLKPAIDAGIPVTNYGMVIAFVQGVYARVIRPFVKDKISMDDYL